MTYIVTYLEVGLHCYTDLYNNTTIHSQIGTITTITLVHRLQFFPVPPAPPHPPSTPFSKPQTP